MDFEYGLDVLFCAWKNANDEKLYHRWIIYAQNEMTFEDFKRKLNVNTAQRSIQPKTEADILKSVKEILNGNIRTTGEN